MFCKFVPYLKRVSTCVPSNKTLKLYIFHKGYGNIPNLNSVSNKYFSTTTKKVALFKSDSCKYESNIFQFNPFSTSLNVSNHKHLDKELEIINQKFPNAKNLLNNFYTMVSNELQASFQLNTYYKLAPHRKGDKYREWMCTYYIKWPEEAKISAVAFTKGEASKKAAIKVLYLLDKAGKILDNGQPLLYDKETFDKVTRKNHVSLVLQSSTENKLLEICNIYESNLREQIQNCSFENSTEERTLIYDNEHDFKNSWSLMQQRNQNIYNYFAKESVQLPIQAHK